MYIIHIHIYSKSQLQRHQKRMEETLMTNLKNNLTTIRINRIQMQLLRPRLKLRRKPRLKLMPMLRLRLKHRPRPKIKHLGLVVVLAVVAAAVVVAAAEVAAAAVVVVVVLVADNVIEIVDHVEAEVVAAAEMEEDRILLVAAEAVTTHNAAMISSLANAFVPSVAPHMSCRRSRSPKRQSSLAAIACMSAI